MKDYPRGQQWQPDSIPWTWRRLTNAIQKAFLNAQNPIKPSPRPTGTASLNLSVGEEFLVEKRRWETVEGGGVPCDEDKGV